MVGSIIIHNGPSEFDNFWNHAMDENGQPISTNLFIMGCGQNPQRFEEAKRVVFAAFEAGRQVGLNTQLIQERVSNNQA